MLTDLCAVTSAHDIYISNILRVPRTSLISCSGTEIAISEVINSEFIFKVKVLLNLPPGTGPRKSAASCQEAYFKE